MSRKVFTRCDRSGFFFYFALSSLGVGLFIARAHPVFPVLVPAIFIGVFLLLLWKPGLGLFSLPVFLPVLNFSPWTGWLIVDEFDLLVLAVVAAGYLRTPQDEFFPQNKRVFFFLLTMLALLVTRGVSGVTMQELDWFADYTTPLNGLRVGKSLLWAILVFPLVVQAGKLPEACRVVTKRFFCVCLLGSFWVVLSVFWERAFYPGVLDILTPYRTVALFWEMHQGGAALDAYLVLLAPLVVWAWRTTQSLPGRSVLTLFVLAFVYVCLTTYSRGVLGAIVVSVTLLSVLLAWRRGKGDHAKRSVSPASVLVLLLVVIEASVWLGGDSFMSKRLAATEHDFGGRLQHWTQGIGLLKTPDEWLFGIGLGKLPRRLTQGETGLALSGSFHRSENLGRQTMVIAGPNGTSSDPELGGLYALSQRVDLISRQRYRFAMDVRSEQDVEMLVQVCALHLLSPASCQKKTIRVSSGDWQRFDVILSGYPFNLNAWQASGHGVMSLSVLTRGSHVDVTNLYLAAGGGNVLCNARFLDEGRGWFPSARSYFLPWHIDNLYLEILIETGLVGLLSFFGVISQIVWRLIRNWQRGNDLAPYFLSCIGGVMTLGLVVSVIDMPRLATLFGFFLIWAWMCSDVSGSGRC